MNLLHRLWRPRVGIAVGLLLLLAWSLTGRWPIVVHWQIPAQSITAEQGKAFLVRDLPSRRWPLHESDGFRGHRASELRLLADDTELGPAHAGHDDVRQAGGGAFSHWADQLWFSTRDDTDPRTNGRTYRIEIPLRFGAAWAWCGGALVALSFAALFHRWLCRFAEPDYWLPRIVGTVLLAFSLCAMVALAGLSWAGLHIEQAVPASRSAPYPPGSDHTDCGRRCLDLFGSQIAWRIPAFLVGEWPRSSAESAALPLHLDDRSATAVASLEQIDAPSCPVPAFTVVSGQMVVVRDDPGGSTGTWRLGLPVRPSRGSWCITLLFAGLGAWLWSGRRRGSARSHAAALCRLGARGLLAIGAVLLLTDLWGAVAPSLRAPDEPLARVGSYGASDRPLSWRQASGQLARAGDELASAYVTRATRLVSDTLGHAWDCNYADELRMHVPATENWLLWLFGEIDARAREYFFVDWRRSLERGIGLCGHAAYALNGLLRDSGLEPRVVQLGGHTVVTVAVEHGSWWIADPDLGVVIPACLGELERDATRGEAAYTEAMVRLGRADPGAEARSLAALYTSDDNFVMPTSADLSVGDADRRLEQLAYALKWWLPAGCLAPWLLFSLWELRRRRRSCAGAAGALGIGEPVL